MTTNRTIEIVDEILVETAFCDNPHDACARIRELARELRGHLLAEPVEAEPMKAADCFCDEYSGTLCLYHYEERQKATQAADIPQKQAEIRAISAALRGTFDNKAR